MKIVKVICNLFIIMFVMLCLLCILWIYIGSLEMYPTAEAEGKAEIAAIAGAVVFGVSASVCVIIKRKQGEKSDEKKTKKEKKIL